MENKARSIILALGFLVSLIAILVSGLIYFQFSGGEWTCIAEECTEFAEGSEWVDQNCELEGNQMMCEFQFEGENFRVPLAGINVSNMISCKVYECSSEVFIRRG